jgi:hypothetical protein
MSSVASVIGSNSAGGINGSSSSDAKFASKHSSHFKALLNVNCFQITGLTQDASILTQLLFMAFTTQFFFPTTRMLICSESADQEVHWPSIPYFVGPSLSDMIRTCIPNKEPSMLLVPADGRVGGANSAGSKAGGGSIGGGKGGGSSGTAELLLISSFIFLERALRTASFSAPFLFALLNFFLLNLFLDGFVFNLPDFFAAGAMDCKSSALEE